MGYPVQRNNTTEPLTFLMVDETDHIAGLTGLTPTVEISKDGGLSWATPVGAVLEGQYGVYQVAANPTDANTLGPLLLHAEAPGADPRDETFSVVEYNPATVTPASPPTSAASGTITAYSIIRQALLKLGAVSHHTQLTDHEAADGLISLNQMIDAWAIQRLTIYVVERLVHDLVSGQQVYTIGPGGDFDQARPIWIDDIGVISNDNPTQPLEIQMKVRSTQQWADSVPVKTVTSAWPTEVWWKKSFPLGELSYWPIPSKSGLETAIYTPTALSLFADLVTQYAFPPGYLKTIIYNLAIDLAPDYEVDAPRAVVEEAKKSMGLIKSANVVVEELRCDTAIVGRGGHYDWRTDQR